MKMTATSARPDAATMLRVRYVMVSLFLFGELDDFDAVAGERRHVVDVVDDVFREMTVKLLEVRVPFRVRDRLVDDERRPGDHVEAAGAAPTRVGVVEDRKQEDLSQRGVERLLDRGPLAGCRPEVVVNRQRPRIA